MATTPEHTQKSRRPTPFHLFPPSALPISSDFPLLTRSTTPRFLTLSHYGTFSPTHLATLASDLLTTNSSNPNPALIHATFLAFFDLAESDTLLYASPQDKPHLTKACWFLLQLWNDTSNTTPDDTDLFTTPRWHQDGRMFTCRCADPVEHLHAKYAVTLLGPATRALKWNERVKAVLEQLQDGYHRVRRSQEQRRGEFARRFVREAGFEEERVETGQVVRFCWGGGDAPVHSEPDVSAAVGGRVYVSLLFGSEEEIKGMCETRGVEFAVLERET